MVSAISRNSLQDALDPDQMDPHVYMAQILFRGSNGLDGPALQSPVVSSPGYVVNT